MKPVVLIIFAAAFVNLTSACTSVKVTYETRNRYYQARTGPVCVLESGLPDGFPHESIGLVQASVKHYAPTEKIAELVANKARFIGADAIVNFKAGQIFRGPFPWGVVGPRGGGIAVRLLSGSSPLNCGEIGGTDY